MNIRQSNLIIDWANALPEPFRSYVHQITMNADPSNHVRDAICWKENAMALAVRVRELEEKLNK